MTGSSPPSLLRFAPCIFYIAKTSALSSLVDSRRIELCLPTLGALSTSVDPFLFVQINSKSDHGGTRTPGPTLLIVVVAFEGNHQTTAATGIWYIYKSEIIEIPVGRHDLDRAHVSVLKDVWYITLHHILFDASFHGTS